MGPLPSNEYLGVSYTHTHIDTCADCHYDPTGLKHRHTINTDNSQKNRPSSVELDGLIHNTH